MLEQEWDNVSSEPLGQLGGGDRLRNGRHQGKEVVGVQLG